MTVSSGEDLARVGATSTAKVFGLYPRKGALVPGADFVLVDPEWEVSKPAWGRHVPRGPAAARAAR